MSDEPGLFEIMYSTRAMRRLKPDPVPEDLLVRLVDAANQAPSGSNAQTARWIIVRDRAQIARIAELNREAVKAYTGPNSRRPASLPHQDAQRRARQLQALLWQADHMHEFPALIIACQELAGPKRESWAAGAGAGGSVWPAVQNLLLAARGYGLGAALTTLAMSNREAFRAILELPENIEPFCVIPGGYPLGRFGPGSRRPLSEIVHWDRW
jgi:nitroreductase